MRFNSVPCLSDFFNIGLDGKNKKKYRKLNLSSIHLVKKLFDPMRSCRDSGRKPQLNFGDFFN